LLAGRPTPPAGREAEPFVLSDKAALGDVVGAFLVGVPASLVRGLTLLVPGAAAVDAGATVKAGTVPIASVTELAASDGAGGGCMPSAS
jgi:hypothetical protein